MSVAQPILFFVGGREGGGGFLILIISTFLFLMFSIRTHTDPPLQPKNFLFPVQIQIE